MARLVTLLPDAAAFRVRAERPSDIAERERLLDAAMGPARFTKPSERLRAGRLPSRGLAFVAEDAQGEIAGTLRLWDVEAGGRPVLLLGPLAVAPQQQGHGLGSMLMHTALVAAQRRGHRAVILVGDAPYYARFGFRPEPTVGLVMPGPVDRRRFLAREFIPGWLDWSEGPVVATGRRDFGGALALAA